MHSFAQRPGASQRVEKSAMPGSVFHRRTSRVNPNLWPQRAGSRTALRRSVTEPEIKSAETAAPSVVRHVLSSPGQPLDQATRRLMESRFDHDFSTVRVHHDSLAAESADAVDARAYTVGRDIVFGQDRYRPGTEQGRSLLAHELMHVVQQRVNAYAGGPLRLGSPADDAERYAGEADSHPVLRRAPGSAETWAGKYIANPYDAFFLQGSGDFNVGYGAQIDITFQANSFVDSGQIAFVQMAHSVRDAKSEIAVKKESERKTAESRAIPEGKPGAGGHIDQSPASRTPVFGMDVKAGGGGEPGLSQVEPWSPKVAKIGWHYTDPQGNVKNEDAWMHDDPKLTSGDIYTEVVQTGEWSQQFETAALALSGVQAGTFYGSVQWGWLKNPLDSVPHLMDFKTKSADAPSPIFMEAAKRWNASVTSGKEKSVDVPVDALKAAKETPLWDSPDKRKKVATLARGTRLARLGTPQAPIFSLGFWLWAKITVIGGKHAKKVGYVSEADISWSSKDDKP